MKLEEFNKSVVNIPRASFAKSFDLCSEVINLVCSESIFADGSLFRQKDFFCSVNEIFHTRSAKNFFLEKYPLINNALSKKSSKRLLRHFIETMSFLGLVDSVNRMYFFNHALLKRISSVSLLKVYVKNFFLTLDSAEWTFTLNKRGLDPNFNFKQYFIFSEIIDYLEKRSVATFFEIAVLFASFNQLTIDRHHWVKEISEVIGSERDSSSQVKKFFEKMNWELRPYKPSESPEFRFKAAVHMLADCGLLKINNNLVTTNEKIKNELETIEAESYFISNEIRSAKLVSDRKKMAGYRSEISGNYSFVNPKGIGYVEVHHIVPISLGGKDAIENTVCLTGDEHKAVHFARIDTVKKINSQILKYAKGFNLFEAVKNQDDLQGKKLTDYLRERGLLE